MMWRWAALVVSVLLVAVAAGAFLFQRQIGEAIFRQAVAENVGRDRGAELPDGLHVFMCGSGSPMPDPARAGPCVGVIAGSHAMVFDIGSGGARRLARMGFPVGRLEKIYLTHLHSDHIDGLGELMLQAWVGGSRSTPLPIAGPEGVGDVVAGFNMAYRLDSTYRTAHHGPQIANPAGFGGVAEVIAAPTGAGHAQVLLDLRTVGDLVLELVVHEGQLQRALIHPLLQLLARLLQFGLRILVLCDVLGDPDRASAAIARGLRLGRSSPAHSSGSRSSGSRVW